MLYCWANGMSDIEGLLNRWQAAGVLGSAAADRIRAWEHLQSGHSPASVPVATGQADSPSQNESLWRIAWQGVVALSLGGLLLACGIVLFVSAHWNEIGPASRLTIVFATVFVFHFAGSATRVQFRSLSTVLHAVGTIAMGAAIALVGQIFNLQEHWPTAVLVWALGGLAGWALLQDQAQQTFALLLVPAWIFTELEYSTELRIGQSAYLGRFLLVWAILYLTAFLDFRRKAVQISLFVVGAIAALAGVLFLLQGWRSGASSLPFLSLGTRLWAWVVIGALPLLFSLMRPRKSLIPVVLALLLSILLPFAQHTWTVKPIGTFPARGSYVASEPNLVAQVLVAAFAMFLIAWGVRLVSRSLVNLGVAYFAMTVAWFYFSDIFSKVGRSIGLIGLGILFLAGGWVLEHFRRRLMAGMTSSPPPETAGSGVAP